MQSVVRRARKDDKPFCFEVVTGDSTFWMHGANDGEREKWMFAIGELGTQLAANTTDYRAQLVAFYKKYNKSRIGTIDQMLAVHKGKERKLLQDLHDKYVRRKKVVPDPEADIVNNVIDGLFNTIARVHAPLRAVIVAHAAFVLAGACWAFLGGSFTLWSVLP